MPISHFYLNGEAAFMEGEPLALNPYAADDEAAEEWRAGWLAASYAAIAVGPTAGASLPAQ